MKTPKRLKQNKRVGGEVCVSIETRCDEQKQIVLTNITSSRVSKSTDATGNRRDIGSMWEEEEEEEEEEEVEEEEEEETVTLLELVPNKQRKYYRKWRSCDFY